MCLAMQIMLQCCCDALDWCIQPCMMTTLVNAFIWLVWQIASVTIITCWVADSCTLSKSITGKCPCLVCNLSQLKWIKHVITSIDSTDKAILGCWINTLLRSQIQGKQCRTYETLLWSLFWLLSPSCGCRQLHVHDWRAGICMCSSRFKTLPGWMKNTQLIV